MRRPGLLGPAGPGRLDPPDGTVEEHRSLELQEGGNGLRDPVGDVGRVLADDGGERPRDPRDLDFHHVAARCPGRAADPEGLLVSRYVLHAQEPGLRGEGEHPALAAFAGEVANQSARQAVVEVRRHLDAALEALLVGPSLFAVAHAIAPARPIEGSIDLVAKGAPTLYQVVRQEPEDLVLGEHDRLVRERAVLEPEGEAALEPAPPRPRL